MTRRPGRPARSRTSCSPRCWAARNRARRREQGDGARAALFGGIGPRGAAAPSSAIVFWLTWQLLDYEELGDYLIRLGLSWLFLTFLSFLAFSGIVTSLSTFFLSEDLRLLLAAPVAARAPLLLALRARRSRQASLDGGGLPAARSLLGRRRSPAAPAPATTSRRVLTLVPFVLIPVALGSVVTLLLVNVFPARRARDILMLMGLLFAVALVLLLRFLRPGAAAERRVAARHHRLLRDPAVAGHAAAAVLLGGRDPLRGAAGRRRLAARRAPCGRPPSPSSSSPASPSAATTSRAGARPRRRARRASRGCAASSALARLPARRRRPRSTCSSRT